MDRIDLFGIRINNLTMDEAVGAVRRLVKERRCAVAVTPNVDHVVKMQSDREFAAICAQAELVVADGMPLVWTSRLAGVPLKERVTGADLFLRICQDAAETGMSVFLLGSPDQETIERTAQVLRDRWPALKIVGSVSPSFTFAKDPVQSAALVAAIRKARPDVLFVGVGAPKQEKWIAQYRQALDVPLSLGVGASFEFAAGTVSRAPLWMQKAGLEWFFRFLSEPKRMFKRYFVDDTAFLALALKEIFRIRSQRSPGS